MRVIRAITELEKNIFAVRQDGLAPDVEAVRATPVFNPLSYRAFIRTRRVVVRVHTGEADERLGDVEGSGGSHALRG